MSSQQLPSGFTLNSHIEREKTSSISETHVVQGFHGKRKLSPDTDRGYCTHLRRDGDLDYGDGGGKRQMAGLSYIQKGG